MTVEEVPSNEFPGMLPTLRFIPLIKHLRWGGTRLGKCLGKEIAEATDAAESWEIADHGTDQSVVATGPFAGWTLSRLMNQYRSDLLGPTAKQTTFPLLLKFLDANDRLSVQVHPNDAQALKFGLTGRGKTEAWHILKAHPDSLIYAGLKPGITRLDLDLAIKSGTLESCVHSFPARAGESFLIPAGTVHSIGEGVLLAEVQQTCDITFRLYDWGRVGGDGLPRPLHIREALECIDYDQGPTRPCVPQPILDRGPNRIEELVACDYFVIRRHVAPSPWTMPPDGRFHICMVLNGILKIESEHGAETLTKGDSVLIPACHQECQFSPQGEVTMLQTFLPPKAVAAN